MPAGRFAMKPISRYIFWCLLAGISINMLKLYFSQNDLANAEEGVFPWYYRLDFIGDILMCLGAVSSFFVYHRYFPAFVRNCYLLLIALVSIASFDAFAEISKQPTFLFSTKGVGTFVNFGILFFAADTRYFPKLLNFFYYLCFLILAASIVNMGKVGLGASRKDFLLYLRDFSVFLMWVFPFFFLQDEPNPRKNMINLAAFLLIFVVVLASGSRSYLILYFIYVIYKFRAQIRRSNGILIIGAAIVLGVSAYFILMSSSLSGTIENAFSNLSERSGEDTRSSQLLDFLDQYDTDYLIQGVGPLKRWFWHGINDYYSFLDNQFLLIAWWAGVPTVLTYIVLLVKAIRTESEIQLFEDVKGLKLIILCWIGACLGLAIYCTVCSEHYYYFLSLIIGLSTCQYSQLMEAEPEPVYDEEDTE